MKYRIIEKYGNTLFLEDSAGKIQKVKVSNKVTKKFRYPNLLVGDLLDVSEDSTLLEVEKRKNVLSKTKSKAKKSFRKATKDKDMAANVDRIFILIAADQKFTVEKLERYLETFTIDNAQITVTISKADYLEGYEQIKEEISQAYPSLSIEKFSKFQEDTTQNIRGLIHDNETIILIGSSGVGKSTLTNLLLEKDVAATKSVRHKDHKGTHTTTTSHLFRLPFADNAYILDTPGFKFISSNKEIRNLEVFSDIQELAKKCKFRNCRHLSEPKCAVKEALKDQIITQEHYESYLNYQERKLNS